MKPKINGHRQTVCVSLSYSIKVHLQRLTVSPPLTWCSPVQHTAPDTQPSQNNNSAIFVVFPTRSFLDVNAWCKRKHWVNPENTQLKQRAGSQEIRFSHLSPDKRPSASYLTSRSVTGSNWEVNSSTGNDSSAPSPQMATPCPWILFSSCCESTLPQWMC